MISPESEAPLSTLTADQHGPQPDEPSTWRKAAQNEFGLAFNIRLLYFFWTLHLIAALFMYGTSVPNQILPLHPPMQSQTNGQGSELKP